MKKNSLIVACFIASAVCMNVSAQTSQENAKNQNEELQNSDLEDDAKFAMLAADASLLEEKLGFIAQKNAASDKVKTLGKHMVDDHSMANAELKALAKRKNITLPTKLSDKSQKEFNRLSKLKGVEFDKDYSKCMVKDHKEVISLFEKEATTGKDADIKSWAQNKISTLQHHLQMSEEIHNAVK
ncbi:MAG: DUF4142 domain-containing protein [Bacteroidota bacterium]|nr:DUF4142 domain-containing protein [Bacteroidota bacterium]